MLKNNQTKVKSLTKWTQNHTVWDNAVLPFYILFCCINTYPTCNLTSSFLSSSSSTSISNFISFLVFGTKAYLSKPGGNSLNKWMELFVLKSSILIQVLSNVQDNFCVKLEAWMCWGQQWTGQPAGVLGWICTPQVVAAEIPTAWDIGVIVGQLSHISQWPS